MTVSHDTVVEAMQEYLADRVRPGQVPTVLTVKPTANTYWPNLTFDLELDAPEMPAAPSSPPYQDPDPPED